MLYTLFNGQLKVTVSDMGAELQSILASDGTEYLWQGDGRYWKDRAPVLFPFVARLTEGCYELDGIRYGMSIHGFACRSRFKPVLCEQKKIVLELTSNEETRAAYPRDFVFRVTCALEGNTVATVYEVTNADRKTMWFGLGAHPGIRVPLKDGLSFSDYRLTFADPCRPVRVGFSPACFLDGNDLPFPLEKDRFLPLRHGMFDDDVIVLKNTSREVTLETDKDRRSVTVRFPGMDYLGIWHRPKTDAPYVCIEPWCSLPAFQDRITVFEEKPDLLRLEPEEVYRNRWEITLT